MKLLKQCSLRIDRALRRILPRKSREPFLVPPRGPVGRRGETVGSGKAASSEIHHHPPSPATSQPRPFFSQWLDSWRSRNEKAS
jgi:hypothetical protein